jgi:cytosine/creatinine deaminase
MQMLIRNARRETSDEIVDIAIHDGRIAALGPGLTGDFEQVIDASGLMAIPPLVNPHFHLENALLGIADNSSGTLREAIDSYLVIKQQMSREDIIARSHRALRSAVSYGTLALRSHVDVDREAGTRLTEAILAVREQWREHVDVQVVAFPQHGLARNPAAVDLMYQCMEMGADLVGGMPHGERDMDDAARHIEIAFEIARKYNADVDMHTDETDDPNWRTLELLAEQTLVSGYQGRVTASHCCSMGRWPVSVRDHVIEKVRAAEITICPNIPINLHLQARNDPPPVPRGIAPIKELLAAGVNVTCGQDDMLNMFYPFGKMDMLEVAAITAHACHLSSPREIEAAFQMPRMSAARALRLEGYGLEPGCWGDLVLIDASSALDALRLQPDRRYVIRRGVVIAETESRRRFHQDVPSSGCRESGSCGLSI